MKIQKSSGFTLIELMIVVAILGILAAASISIYREYVSKSQVTRAVGEISALKTGFEESVSQMGPVTNDALGYVPSNLTDGNASSDVAVLNSDGSGHIEVTLGGSAHPAISGAVVRFSRSVSGIWSCAVDPANAPDWKATYLPPGCSES